MRFTGTVTVVEDGQATVDVVGAVVSTGSTDGNHVNATVVISTGLDAGHPS